MGREASSVGQISAAITEMSEANKDLLEKYRKEVALRRKYHEQLVELKGRRRDSGGRGGGRVRKWLACACRQHPRAVPREAGAEGGPAAPRGPAGGGGDHGPQQRVLAQPA